MKKTLKKKLDCNNTIKLHILETFDRCWNMAAHSLLVYLHSFKEHQESVVGTQLSTPTTWFLVLEDQRSATDSNPFPNNLTNIKKK